MFFYFIFIYASLILIIIIKGLYSDMSSSNDMVAERYLLRAVQIYETRKPNST